MSPWKGAGDEGFTKAIQSRERRGKGISGETMHDGTRGGEKEHKLKGMKARGQLFSWRGMGERGGSIAEKSWFTVK